MEKLQVAIKDIILEELLDQTTGKYNKSFYFSSRAYRSYFCGDSQLRMELVLYLTKPLQ